VLGMEPRTLFMPDKSSTTEHLLLLPHLCCGFLGFFRVYSLYIVIISNRLTLFIG
jgi:hypothetical protein